MQTFLNRLDEFVETPLLNPVTVEKKRGRPAGAKNKYMTRDRSQFEHVEAELNGRKCSNAA